MTKETKSAIKKIKAAKLTPTEALGLANWLAQTVAVQVTALEGLSDDDFFAAQDEIAGILQGKLK